MTNAALCTCGHSHGWHNNAGACSLDGCKCRAFEASCHDTGQETSGPHFTDVGGNPGCEHGVAMDEHCDACADAIDAYDAKLAAEEAAHNQMLDSLEREREERYAGDL